MLSSGDVSWISSHQSVVNISYVSSTRCLNQSIKQLVLSFLNQWFVQGFYDANYKWFHWIVWNCLFLPVFSWAIATFQCISLWYKYAWNVSIFSADVDLNLKWIFRFRCNWRGNIMKGKREVNLKFNTFLRFDNFKCGLLCTKTFTFLLFGIVKTVSVIVNSNLLEFLEILTTWPSSLTPPKRVPTTAHVPFHKSLPSWWERVQN